MPSGIADAFNIVNSVAVAGPPVITDVNHAATQANVLGVSTLY